MLQRIQSIWLLLVAAFAAITFRFPFYSGDRVVDTTTNETGHVDLVATTTIWLTIVTVIIGALAFITIFLFDNRKLQARLTFLGIFLTIVLLVMYFLQVGNYTAGKGTFALSCIFYFAILAFYILAARGILKDDKLIKSMDRLR
jgi:hypothetical protein